MRREHETITGYGGQVFHISRCYGNLVPVMVWYSRKSLEISGYPIAVLQTAAPVWSNALHFGVPGAGRSDPLNTRLRGGYQLCWILNAFIHEED